MLVYLPECLSVYQCSHVYFTVLVLFVCRPINMSVFMSVFVSIHLHVCLSVNQSISSSLSVGRFSCGSSCLSVDFPFCLFSCLSVNQSICLSICRPPCPSSHHRSIVYCPIGQQKKKKGALWSVIRIGPWHTHLSARHCLWWEIHCVGKALLFNTHTHTQIYTNNLYTMHHSGVHALEISTMIRNCAEIILVRPTEMKLEHALRCPVC